jgi:hypothetical protein
MTNCGPHIRNSIKYVRPCVPQPHRPLNLNSLHRSETPHTTHPNRPRSRSRSRSLTHRHVSERPYREPPPEERDEAGVYRSRLCTVHAPLDCPPQVARPPDDQRGRALHHHQRPLLGDADEKSQFASDGRHEMRTNSCLDAPMASSYEMAASPFLVGRPR